MHVKERQLPAPSPDLGAYVENASVVVQCTLQPGPWIKLGEFFLGQDPMCSLIHVLPHRPPTPT